MGKVAEKVNVFKQIMGQYPTGGNDCDDNR